MINIVYHKVISKDEIEILHNKESIYKGFSYKYGKKTIDLLKNNFNRENSLYIVAKQEDEFVGFVSCDTDWWENNCFFIREIFVNPDFQKQEIGKKLMEDCINHAKKHKSQYVITETAFENLPMQKLCAKLGFEEWNNPEWKDGITYKLTLS
ncbi:MAG: GNAT family N-acetyltransferase [Candidatus Magasanikbacteria bacterium]